MGTVDNLFFRSFLVLSLLALLLAGCPPSETEPPEVPEREPVEEAEPAEPVEEAEPAEEPADPTQAPEDVAEPPEDAERTESGLASKVLTPGEGETHPTGTSRVTVHYSGWTTDGEMFDSSVVRGEPATFPLDQVIPGWTEGVQLMVVGEKRRFWIPEELAYRGMPGRPQGMLVFDVELIEIH